MTAPSILVVEDRDGLRELLVEALAAEGFTASAAADGLEAVRRIAGGEHYDLVLTDLQLPGCDGLEVLRVAREQRPAPAVIVLSAYGTVRTAVEAMRRGALDFLEKPLELEDLFELVRRALDRTPPPTAFEAPGVAPIIGRDPRLTTALNLLRKVAPTDSTVLLTGESGTGKELFARSLHALSRRAAGPFIAVNCAAIPESLMESELFGHERGAFTGADRRQIGRFERATGGTLLLDEVGELAIGVQAKVLRAIEERAIERVGGTELVHCDVRLVAATNRDLRAMVHARSFRSDLYYRLDVFPIELPPLRERPGDIPDLTRHLAAEVAERSGQAAIDVDAEALAWLAQCPWPGNVRELANLLERATIVGPGRHWGREELADLRGGREADDASPEPRDGSPTGEAASHVEAGELREALRATGGDKQAAARRLGISYRTLQRRVVAHDLEGFPRFRD